MKDWKSKKLGEIMTLKYGSGLPERSRIKGNIPVYGSNGIVGFHNVAKVKESGVIVGRKGSAGEVVYSATSFFPIDTTYYVESNLVIKINRPKKHCRSKCGAWFKPR